MQIIGIGIDMIKIQRIKTSLKNKKFTNRIFSKREITFSKNVTNKSSYFSKRFAAKEAFAKALGTGFRKSLNFKDIQILNDKLGKPYYNIDNKIRNLIKKYKKVRNFQLFLSISDEKEYSIAFAIIQKIK